MPNGFLKTLQKSLKNRWIFSPKLVALHRKFVQCLVKGAAKSSNTGGESRLFWLSLVMSQVFWVVFVFAALITLSFKWLVNDCFIALHIAVCIMTFFGIILLWLLNMIVQITLITDMEQSSCWPSSPRHFSRSIHVNLSTFVNWRHFCLQCDCRLSALPHHAILRYIIVLNNNNNSNNNSSWNHHLNWYRLLKFVTTDSCAVFCRKRSRLIKQTWSIYANICLNTAKK